MARFRRSGRRNYRSYYRRFRSAPRRYYRNYRNRSGRSFGVKASFTSPSLLFLLGLGGVYLLFKDKIHGLFTK